MNATQKAFEIQIKSFSELDDKVSSAFDEIINKHETGITGQGILVLHEKILNAVWEAEKNLHDFFVEALSREAFSEMLERIPTKQAHNAPKG